MLFSILVFTIALAAVDVPQVPVVPSDDEKTIQWIVNDFPPYLVLNSNKTEVDMSKAKGPLAEAYRLLDSGLPQYKHKYLRVPFVRMQKIIESKKPFCSLMFQETPARAQFLQFGEEIGRTIPAGLVVKSGAKAKYAVDGGKVDLAKTLQLGSFRLGVVAGRSYSPEVDEILQRNQVSFRLMTDQAVGGLFQMLDAGRLDGVLAYYLEKSSIGVGEDAKTKFKFIPVKQSTEAIILKASCVKTPWGTARLKDINPVIREKKFKDISLKHVLAMLPEQERKEYLELHRESEKTKPGISRGD
ncbi:TIGR02285 family protein [Bdellovibrio bacteriovorus]